MSKKLTDLEIDFISLVRVGANNKEIIYKSALKESQENNFNFILKKINQEKVQEGLVYGVVYSPDELDSQDEFTTAIEIKKASYAFMKNLKNLNIDKNHSGNNENAFVCESWIIKEHDALFPQEKAGSWAIGIKIEDLELKKSLENGEIQGISMAGRAKKTETVLKNLNKENKSFLAELKKILIGEKNMKKEDNNEKPQENDELNVALIKQVAKNEQSIEELKKSNSILEDELKKSQQVIEVNKKQETSSFVEVL